MEAESFRSLAVWVYESLFILASEADDWTALERHSGAALHAIPCMHQAHLALLIGLAMQERFDEAVRYGELVASGAPCGCATEVAEDARDLTRQVRDGSLKVKTVRDFLARG